MMTQFQGFKLAQRVIAITVTVNFFIAFWCGVGIYLMKPDKLEGYLNLVGTFELGYIMLAIIAWYFTAGSLNFKKT